jgi:potassium efflux system protein
MSPAAAGRKRNAECGRRHSAFSIQHSAFSIQLACAALLALVPSGVQGQPATPEAVPALASPAEEISRDTVLARLKRIEESDSLDAAAKARLQELYGQALRELDQASRRLAEAAGFEQMIKSEPQQLRQVKEELASLPSAPTVTEPAGADLNQLQQELKNAEDAVAKAKEALAGLEAEPKRRAARKREIPGLLSSMREQLAQTTQQILALKKQEDPSALASAERTLMVARRQRIQQELAALEQEAAAYDATTELLRLRRDVAAARRLLAEETEKQWREIAHRRSQEKAQDDTETARLEAERTLPALRPLADARHALASENKAVSARLPQVSQELEEVKATLEKLTKQYTRTRERVNAAGLTYAIGLLLRSQRAALPDLGYHERARRARRSEIRDTQLRLLELEDRRSEMASPERQVRTEMDRLGPLPDGVEAGDLEPIVRDLLAKQRDQLDELISNYDSYFEMLVAQDEADGQLIKEIAAYAKYIDERAFWIGSTAPLRPSDLRLAGMALAWLAAPQNWAQVFQALLVDAVTKPLLNLLAICLLAVLFYKRRYLRAVLNQTGEVARQSTLCRILPTFTALGATLLLAAAWPALLWYVGWRLVNSLTTSEFVGAVAAGLIRAAVVYFPLEFTRQVCRQNGLAEAHFRWPAGGLASIRTNLKWLAPSVLPLVFAAATLRIQSNRGFENSLGRMCLIAEFLLVAVFFHRVLRPSGDFFRHVLAYGDDGWLYRFRHIWYLLGVLSPLALAGLSGLGYDYTANELAAHLRRTVYVPLALILAAAFLLRWVMVVRRRLAITRARQRNTAEPPEAAAAAEDSQAASGPAPCEPQVDLTTVSQQTRRLIRALLVAVGILCVWYIWVDALPALGILKEVPIWPVSAWGDGRVAGPGGPVGITLADIGLTVLIVVVTLIAARNISGLLEIAVLQHLPMEAGTRYAIATVSRYVTIVVGLVFACGVLGIRWSTVQWLVAAVSVGLGFGLQEIFANFVSGLVLLFERPVRVGDIVTIGDVTGTVSRIQIRATTIRNWDRKELIVPNKEFITGRLLNWTLSDRVNRLVVNVGIAYGSDTERARDLLQKIARDHPLILNDPAPLVTFEEFRDSTLHFVLRCFLPTLENRLRVIHDLHTQIHRVFREQGIEIAFPQCDIHVRSAGLVLQAGGDGIDRDSLSAA